MHPFSVLTASVLINSVCAHWIPEPLKRQSSCNESALNTTVGTYKVATGDTIFSIANATDRGACDIARYNRMADAEAVYVGEALSIPPQVCEPDNDTCLLVDTNPTMDCVLGGPHVYTTVGNETIESIATYKFNITAESLFNTSSRMLPTNATVQTVLESGQALKLPLCFPSQCGIQPYQMTQEVYKDMAAMFGSTVGQIIALNPSYNHSSGGDPVLTVPVNCTLLSSNYTVM